MCGKSQVGGKGSLFTKNQGNETTLRTSSLPNFSLKSKTPLSSLPKSRAKGTCSHVCFSFGSRVTQMPCGLNETCSRAEIMSTTCRLSWSLETGAARVSFKHATGFPPRVTWRRGVGFSEPCLCVSERDTGGPCLHPRPLKLSQEMAKARWLRHAAQRVQDAPSAVLDLHMSLQTCPDTEKRTQPEPNVKPKKPSHVTWVQMPPWAA